MDRVNDRPSIDELLDRAVGAFNRGDQAGARTLADQILSRQSNAEAEDLLAATPGDGGEIRRLTILFADLVDSTVLSRRLEPEPYRTVVGRYRELVGRVVARFEGHIAFTKGDGLLAVFGHPIAHEDDVLRAVRAGLEIIGEVRRLSAQSQRRFGVGIGVRVGVHRGPVYLDVAQDDVYGLAANLAARVCSLAVPGTVVVSDAVQPLIADEFEVEHRQPTVVKGIEDPIAHYEVKGPRTRPTLPARGPLIGRDREVSELHRSWELAVAGKLTTPGLVIRGEPGIGKSRLVAEITDMAFTGTVLELHGSTLHLAVEFHPVRVLIENRCGTGERLQLLRAELARLGLPDELVPLLAPVLGIAADAGYEPLAAEGFALQRKISQAVRDYMLACVADGPGLIVAEDAHWFDPATLALLGQLMSDGRILVVAAGRPGDWLPANWPVQVLDLAPLSDEQTDMLTDALGPDLTPEQRRVVRERCDGVPFYVEQVVADLRATHNGSSPGVPDALYEPLFARLRSSSRAVPVLQCAAVIGREGDRPLLAQTAGLDETVIDPIVDELVDTQVFDDCGTHRWRFRHELLREVATEMAPPSVKRRLHVRAGDALLARSNDRADWPLVASHYEHGERFADAAAAYRRAAADARLRGAIGEARTHLSKALEQLADIPADAERDLLEVRLRLERGHLTGLVDGYQRPAASGDFERCLQLLAVRPAADELISTLTAVISYHLVHADMRRMAEIVDMMRDQITDGGPRVQLIAETALAICALAGGDVVASGPHLEAAETFLRLANPRGPEAISFLGGDIYGTVCTLWAEQMILKGDLAGAEEQCRKAIALADQMPAHMRALSGSSIAIYRCWILFERRQFAASAAVAAENDEFLRTHGVDTVRLQATTMRAAMDALVEAHRPNPDRQAFSGSVGEAIKLLDVWRRVGLEALRPMYDVMVGLALNAAGEHERAREWLDTALSVTADSGQTYYDAELLRLRAGTDIDAGARYRGLLEARQLARSQGTKLFELRAALDDFALNGGPARETLVEALSGVPADCGAPDLERARELLARVTG